MSGMRVLSIVAVATASLTGAVLAHGAGVQSPPILERMKQRDPGERVRAGAGSEGQDRPDRARAELLRRLVPEGEEAAVDACGRHPPWVARRRSRQVPVLAAGGGQARLRRNRARMVE